MRYLVLITFLFQTSCTNPKRKIASEITNARVQQNHEETSCNSKMVTDKVLQRINKDSLVLLGELHNINAGKEHFMQLIEQAAKTGNLGAIAIEFLYINSDFKEIALGEKFMKNKNHRIDKKLLDKVFPLDSTADSETMEALYRKVREIKIKYPTVKFCQFNMNFQDSAKTRKKIYSQLSPTSKSSLSKLKIPIGKLRHDHIRAAALADNLSKCHQKGKITLALTGMVHSTKARRISGTKYYKEDPYLEVGDFMVDRLGDKRVLSIGVLRADRRMKKGKSAEFMNSKTRHISCPKTVGTDYLSTLSSGFNGFRYFDLAIIGPPSQFITLRRDNAQYQKQIEEEFKE